MRTKECIIDKIISECLKSNHVSGNLHQITGSRWFVKNDLPQILFNVLDCEFTEKSETPEYADGPYPFENKANELRFNFKPKPETLGVQEDRVYSDTSMNPLARVKELETRFIEKYATLHGLYKGLSAKTKALEAKAHEHTVPEDKPEKSEHLSDNADGKCDWAASVQLLDDVKQS